MLFMRDLTFSWQGSMVCGNPTVGFHCESMDWFSCDGITVMKKLVKLVFQSIPFNIKVINCKYVSMVI